MAKGSILDRLIPTIMIALFLIADAIVFWTSLEMLSILPLVGIILELLSGFLFLAILGLIKCMRGRPNKQG